METRIRFAALWSLVLVSACMAGPRETDADDPVAVRQEIAAAMQRYQSAARTVDPDATAAFFAPTATLFEPGIPPIRTRDSIRAFIASFPGVRVDSATATPDTIEVFGGTAFLWGSYFERLAFPGQAASEQHGQFVAQWVRQPDGTWLIQRLFRVPVSTALFGTTEQQR